MKKMNADIMLLIVAVIWGTGFIMTEYAMDAGLSPIQIMAGRFSVAALTICIFVAKDLKLISKKEWFKGSLAGVFLFLGFFFQTVGQSQTTVTNSAFLTATNVVIVPFLAWALTRKKPRTRVFMLAVLTFVGVAILTVSPEGGASINIGDLYVLLGAVMFAFHISYLGIAVDGNNPLVITFIQMGVSAILSYVGLLISGGSDLSNVVMGQGIGSVVYLGLFSTCICFFMQTSAQQRTTAAKTGIILSTESLFGTIFSIILGIDPLTTNVVLGGVIIMTAVIMTEVDFGKKSELKEGLI